MRQRSEAGHCHTTLLLLLPLLLFVTLVAMVSTSPADIITTGATVSTV